MELNKLVEVYTGFIDSMEGGLIGHVHRRLPVTKGVGGDSVCKVSFEITEQDNYNFHLLLEHRGNKTNIGNGSFYDRKVYLDQEKPKDLKLNGNYHTIKSLVQEFFSDYKYIVENRPSQSLPNS